MPTLIPGKPEKPQKPSDYAGIDCLDYKQQFNNSFVECSLNAAVSTYEYNKSLKFFMNETIPNIDEHDLNSIKQKQIIDDAGNEVNVDDIKYKFKVVIGTTANLEEHYKEPCPTIITKKASKGSKVKPLPITLSLLDKLNEFYPAQFQYSEKEKESVKNTVNTKTNIHIIIIGHLVTTYMRKEPKYNIEEKILGAVTFAPSTQKCTSVLWIAVDTTTKYNKTNWHNENKNEEVIDDPPIQCAGFGRFLLASVQHHSMIMKNHNKLILQSNDDTYHRFYHGLHFTKLNNNHEEYVTELKKTSFIDDAKLHVYQSNCNIHMINPTIYEDSKELNVLSLVKERILNIYFDGLGVSYANNRELNNGTKEALTAQFPNIAKNSLRIYRHSITVNDDATIIIDADSSPIRANAQTLMLTLNYKNSDSSKSFYVQNHPMDMNFIEYNSLFHTISTILYSNADYAVFLYFTVSYFYDVLSRLDVNHKFFKTEENNCLFQDGVKLLIEYRKRSNDDNELKKLNKTAPVDKEDKELKAGTKKELLCYMAKDYDYEMRHKNPSIALIDLSVLSSLFNIQFVVYQAFTKANQSLVFKYHKQRSWCELVCLIPKLNLFIGGKKKVTQFLHFIALSVHDNNIYGHITIKNEEIIDIEKPLCVEAIACNFDLTKFDSITAMAKDWIKDRRNKEYPVFAATNTEWEFEDMILKLEATNVIPFLRMIDPFATKLRKHNPDDALSMDGKIVVTYESFRSLSPKKWLKQHVIDAFVKALSSYSDVKSGEVVIISPTDMAEIAMLRDDIVFDTEKRFDKRNFNYASHSSQVFIERINKATDVYLIVHDNIDHYYTVEFNMKDAMKIQKYHLFIADSFYHGKGRSFLELFNLLRSAKILTFINDIRPGFSFDIFEAKNVSIQPDSTECGVHCCRRVYSKVIHKKILDPKFIDNELGSTRLFRLNIAQEIISKSAYMSLYVSHTGSYPVTYESAHFMPKIIELKIATYEIERKQQYPDLVIKDLKDLERTKDLQDDIDVNESKIEIFNSNDSFVDKSVDLSVWSLSINSGKRFHNNYYGVENKSTSNKNIVEINSSIKKVPGKIEFDKSMVAKNLNKVAVGNENVNKNKRKKEDNDSKLKAKKIKTLKITKILLKDSTEYNARMSKRNNYYRKGAKTFFNKQPRRKKGDLVTPLDKEGIKLKKKEWDEHRLSTYKDHLELGLIERPKEEAILLLEETKKTAIIEAHPDVNENALQEHWQRLYFMDEQNDNNTTGFLSVMKTINSEMAVAREKYEATNKAYNDEATKKGGGNKKKLKTLSEKIINLNSELEIRKWEKDRVKIFHKSNSIFAIKIEGDQEIEDDWVYYAVYKGDDDVFYETRLTYEWLQANLEASYLRSLRQQKQMGNYLIKKDSELQFVRAFPVNDYVKDKRLRFHDPIWRYEVENKKMKLQYLRAVITFDKKKTDEMNITIMTNFSVCFVKNNSSSSEQKNQYISVDYNHMTEIFSLDKINMFRDNIAKWWSDDCNYLNAHRGGCVFIPPKCTKRFVDYKDEMTNQFFELIPAMDKIPLRCTKSPLGIVGKKQVYYWKFGKDDKYAWNQTTSQISMMRWDEGRQQFLGKEWCKILGEKKTTNLEPKWVDENFPGIGEKLKEFATKFNVPRYFEVPLANGRHSDDELENPDNPKIKYYQNDNKSCCFYSLCSSLDYLNYNDEAKRLRKYRDYFFKKEYLNNFFQIDFCIIEHIKCTNEYLKLQANFEIIKIEQDYDIFETDVNVCDIRLLVLAGEDGSENHAVCIIDKYIFDSNCKYALDFNIEGLNECCSGKNFHHIVRGFHFHKLQN